MITFYKCPLIWKLQTELSSYWDPRYCFSTWLLIYSWIFSQGFCLSFLTQLDRSSHPAVQSLIRQHLLGHVNAASLLKQPLPMPQGSGQFCNFEGFWIAVGNNEPVVSSEYVLTASVKANLKDLSRVVSARYVAFVSAFSAFIEGHIS